MVATLLSSLYHCGSRLRGILLRPYRAYFTIVSNPGVCTPGYSYGAPFGALEDVVPCAAKKSDIRHQTSDIRHQTSDINLIVDCGI